jgi:hypothetical protein
MDLSLSSSMEEDQQLVGGDAPHPCSGLSEQHKAGMTFGYLEHGPSGSMNSQNSFAEALLFAQVTNGMAQPLPVPS